MAHPEKPRKKIKPFALLMMLFLAVIMITSVLAIFLNSAAPPEQNEPYIPEQVAENSFTVGNYTFYINQDGDFWTYSLLSTGQYIPIVFRMDPRDAENIPFEPEVLRAIRTSGKIYTSYNPNDEELAKTFVAVGEVARLLPITAGHTSIDAYTEDSDPVNPMVPIKTCEDATGDVTVIEFELADETGVYSNGNCVIVRGEDPDKLILAADKLGMQLIGLDV